MTKEAKSNSEFSEFEKDLKILNDVRDSLVKEFKACKDPSLKIGLAAQLNSTIHVREDVEVFLMKLGGYEPECEGCSECDPGYSDHIETN